MFHKKQIVSLVFIGLLTSISLVRADDISDAKPVLTNAVAKLIQTYEARIQALETENTALKQELTSLKGTGATIIGTGTIPTISPSNIPSAIATGTDTYSQIINKINSNLSSILTENKLPAYTAIGLFEFISPNAFFISLDDGNNPSWVTAFKTKILYKYDSALNFIKAGVFDLDYASQRYVTIFGSNPYSTVTRTRVKNSSYRGKLLESATTIPSSSSTVPNTPIITPSPITTVSNTDAEVTFAQIKTAYSKNKLLDALKLSDQYIVQNPSSIEVLRIRYRSYYMIGKYENSLAEIKKIEALQWTAFEKTIACDAAVIGKIAKKTDISNYYGIICKK